MQCDQNLNATAHVYVILFLWTQRQNECACSAVLALWRKHHSQLRALDFKRKIHYCCKENYFAKNDMWKKSLSRNCLQGKNLIGFVTALSLRNENKAGNFNCRHFVTPGCFYGKWRARALILPLCHSCAYRMYSNTLVHMLEFMLVSYMLYQPLTMILDVTELTKLELTLLFFVCIKRLLIRAMPHSWISWLGLKNKIKITFNRTMFN